MAPSAAAAAVAAETIAASVDARGTETSRVRVEVEARGAFYLPEKPR
jgi:hypothetical protein